MSNKDLVKKEEGALVDESMFAGMSSGFEDTSSDTFKIPFLKILQTTNPEVDKDDPAYVAKAAAGMYLNDATKAVYESINVVVLKIVHNLIVWKPNRGGLVGIFDKSQEPEVVARKDGPFKYDANDNEVDDTISFYLMNADDPSDVMVFPVSRTSFKYGQAFATRLRALKMNNKPIAVTWAGIWNIAIANDSNDKGKWKTIGNTPEFKEFVSKDLVNNFIKPSLEMLKTAETDFNTMKDSDGMKNVTEDDEAF